MYIIVTQGLITKNPYIFLTFIESFFVYLEKLSLRSCDTWEKQKLHMNNSVYTKKLCIAKYVYF